MHSSLAVANKLLKMAQDQGKTLTPMQLIKLVYLSHGWMLGLYGRPMLEESVEAWQYGPVIPDLYHKIKNRRDMPVSYPIKHYLGVVTEEFDDAEEHILSEVYRLYGDRSGIHLSALTHKPDSPWDVTWNNYGRNAAISNDLIEHHYKELYARQKSESA